MSDTALRRLALLLGLAVAFGLAAAAWVTGLVLYADGALFSFVVGVDAPWRLVWHIMPARLAVYLLTVAPAALAREAGLSGPAAMQLYQLLFLGLPYFGLAACLVLVPRGRRFQLLFPVVSILALSTSALGYPSETTLTLASFWPALLGHRHARPAVGGLALTLVCTAIFLFSHPGMVFALPLLPLAAALRWREDAAQRRVLAGLLVIDTGLAALWAWRFSVETGDPGIVQSSQRMWSATGLAEVVTLQPVILAVLIALLLWAVLGWQRDRTAPALALFGLPALALLFGLLHREAVTPESHYYIRTALVFLLPLLGMLALWRGRAAPSGAAALGLMAALAGLQLQHNLAFLEAWTDYRDSLAAAVSAGPPRIATLQQIQDGRSRPTARSIAWSWGQPYLSLTLPGAAPYRAIVADPGPESYSPFQCSQMPAITAQADWVPAETLAVLKDYVCARRPG